MFQFPLYCLALTFSGSAHSAAPFNAADAWSVGRLATKRLLVNETLLTIAEVSVGFAGFASLVTVLGKRCGAEALQDSLRIRIMLVYSLSVAFLCFLPAILREYALPEATVW